LQDRSTDFEFLPIDVSLGRCQRYYNKITNVNAFLSGYNTTDNYAVTTIGLAVTMRATPSATFTGSPLLTNAYQQAVQGNSSSLFYWTIRAVATGNLSSFGDIVFILDSEL
jgi:hypothetical protein